MVVSESEESFHGSKLARLPRIVNGKVSDLFANLRPLLFEVSVLTNRLCPFPDGAILNVTRAPDAFFNPSVNFLLLSEKRIESHENKLPYPRKLSIEIFLNFPVDSFPLCGNVSAPKHETPAAKF